MRNARAFLIRCAIFAAACSVLFATYSYYFTDTLTSINTTNWTQNGTLTAGSGGLTSSNANGGSLISKVAVPDGTSDYEVKTTLTLTQSGGTYVTYLRASTNALSGPAAAGTAYALELQNPTFSGSACTATLALYKIVSAAVTSLGATTVPCSNGMTIRAVYTAYSNQMAFYLNNDYYGSVVNSVIATGQPGIGVRGAPAGDSISKVQLGGIYTGSPSMPPSTEIGVSAFANRVDIQWPGASEAASGPGVAFYQILRNGALLANEYLSEAFSDPTVSPSTTYTYTINAFDYDMNVNGVTITVATPPTGAIDARETGVRSTGSYWGGGGEQIDMRSGNLNYTTPILKAMGRGGWGVGFNLTYNSQNWRQDPGGTWQLGEDVGYGYGWKLLAGSLLPLSSASGIAEYLFTDSTGAQYHLNQDTGGIWTSLESIYVTYDSNTGKLHFNDGSFWVMGSTSAGTEWDAGTMYPTLMEDSNGNEVIIIYNNGLGVTWNNSSSRISTIEDVRGNGGFDFSFSYNSDTIPHLTGITNLIGSENFSFAYTENYALKDPFAGQNFGTVALLQSSTVTGIPLETYFTYDDPSAVSSCGSVGTGTYGAGQLTQVTTPYCGHLRWTYTTANTLSGSRTYNEVASRFLSMSSGVTESEIDLNRATDTSYSVHSSAALDDTPSNSEKFWSFQTDTTRFNGGLQLTYEERTKSPSVVPLSHFDFTWAQTPTTLNSYIGTTVTKLDPSQTYTQWKQTIQTLDQYGNLLTMKAYNFGNGAVGSLARTYTNTYLTDSNYTPLYIFNRLLTSTVTDGTNTATLVSNSYDQHLYTNITTTCLEGAGPCEHDNTNYPYTFTYRGDVSTSTALTSTTQNYLDMTGTITSTTANGVTSSITSTNNYAAPGQITTNSLTSTMTWTNALGLNSATGPNGDTGSINYDAYARPSTIASPYGAVTTNTYNDAASPPNKIAMTDKHGTKTVMDGFGRTIHTITGYGTTNTSITTVLSTVDVQYAPCGCSPLGKLSQQSQPYAPGGSDAWTIYHYDASGRTTSVVLPDNSTTYYVYQGNTVKVTDPANNSKTFTMDALGNLVSVLEPDPTLGNVSTNYTYDILNHLTGVSMPRGSNTQTRTFNYNSGTTVTGFLQSATNPENGTVTYTYSGNLLATKTDAKNQKLIYAYDSYNRLSTVTLSPSTVIRTYYYDTNPLDTTGFSQNIAGRLAAVKYPAQSTIQMNDMYSYTAAGTAGAGLPATKRLQVNQPVEYQDNSHHNQNENVVMNLDSTYSYNGEGEVTAMTYPSTGTSITPVAGASYAYSYDSMYRLGGMTSGGTTIVNNVTYNAANQLLTMTYDLTTETRGYNILNQLTSINSHTVAYGTIENLTYNYPIGNDNGKISSMYNAVSGETVTYTYDSLNRLLTASGTGGASAWGQQYGFDGFGNLLSKTVTAGSGPSLSISVNTANNQIQGVSGLSYDANGNQNVGTYDAENRLTTAGTLQYDYDAQNKRIWSWPGATDSLNNTTSYTVNMYAPSGQKLGAYLFVPATTTQGGLNVPELKVTLASSDTYFGARRLAVMDQLGSAVWNSPSSSGSFFPWGEAKGGYNPQDTWNFATYWQDSNTSLDYANNRFYSNAYGRFATADPFQASAGPNDPGSWNRYAYTRGDPVNRNDAQGLDDCETCVAGEGGDPGFGGDPTGYCPPSEQSCAPFPAGGGTGGGGGTGSSSPGLSRLLGALALDGCTVTPTTIECTIELPNWRLILQQLKFYGWLGTVVFERGLNIILHSGKNRRENQQFADAVKEYERKCGVTLTDDQLRQLHDAVTGEGYTYQDIVELAMQIFGCPAGTQGGSSN